MKGSRVFEQVFNQKELRVFARLDSPPKIQDFLDKLSYRSKVEYSCPRTVLRQRQAHCFDGALFGAAALRRLGYPPLIVDMQAVRDDDHLLAIFKQDGNCGAVAKSNFVGLRFRDPIYRSLRELVVSYFDSYYNLEGEKSLRGYTTPLDLRRMDSLNWMTSDDQLETIADKLDQIRSYRLLTDKMIERLVPVDKRTFDAGMLGVNPDGLSTG